MKNRILTLILGLLLSASCFSQQPELNLPPDVELAAEARRRFARSVDEIMVKRYRLAADAINWLLINTPDLYDGLYVNAYKAYEELYAIEADAAKKQVYLDSMFLAYELKDQRYELTDREINNLAYRYYKYYKTDRSKYSKMKAAFDRAFEKPEVLINNNLVAYMDVYRRIFLGPKTVSENDVLDAYTKVGLAIEQKLSKGGDRKRLERNKQVVDQMLTSAVDVNCEFIATKLYPEFLKNPDDLNMAKKILQLGLSGKCSSEDFFLKAAEVINKNEPTAPIANMIANTYALQKNFELAEQYFLKTISLQDQDTLKARTYLSMARTFSVNGEKAKSRDAALKVAEKNPALSATAYGLIGNLYMGSFDDCKQSKSQIDDRAIFLLAYEAYQKAGDKKGMASAQEQFPTISQAFEQNRKEGDKLTVGCWINRTATLKTRSSN